MQYVYNKSFTLRKHQYKLFTDLPLNLIYPVLTHNL